MRIFALPLALCTLTACAEASPPAAAPDLDAIRDTVLQLEGQLNAEAMALNCSMPELGDGDPLYVSQGNVVPTRAEFVEACAQMVAPRTPGEYDAERITANVLSPDAAIVVREGNLTINFRERESWTGPVVVTTVWQRGEDGWKAVHIHESSPQTPDGD
jgi:hypothetical protein